MVALFNEFKTERRLLMNVSPKTVEWYDCSWKAFQSHLSEVEKESDLQPSVRQAVMEMAEARRLTPTSINDYARCMNAFMRWLRSEGHIAAQVSIPKLKTTHRLPNMMSETEVQRFVHYRPRNRMERRVHTIALVVLDTGMRISEALNLRKCDLDLENLLIKIQKGKGDRQRVVPITFQLRRLLYRHVKADAHPLSEFVFSTRNGPPQTYRNALRQLRHIGDRLKIPNLRFHSMRHLFATHYLKSGGSIALLRKVLGHSSLEVTLVYEHLQTDDLARAHNGHSILARYSKT